VRAGADMHDRINDVILRASVSDWFAHNGGSARLGPDPHALEKLQYKIPAYDGQGELLKGGEWGGDAEFIAAPSLIGARLFAYTEGAAGYELGSLFSERGAGGLTGGQRTMALGEAIYACVKDGALLRVCKHVGGVHWHALLPVSANGVASPLTCPEPLASALGDAARRSAAARRIERHDAAAVAHESRQGRKRRSDAQWWRDKRRQA
jgi:hypothetical protein